MAEDPTQRLFAEPQAAPSLPADAYPEEEVLLGRDATLSVMAEGLLVSAMENLKHQQQQSTAEPQSPTSQPSLKDGGTPQQSPQHPPTTTVIVPSLTSHQEAVATATLSPTTEVARMRGASVGAGGGGGAAASGDTTSSAIPLMSAAVDDAIMNEVRRLAATFTGTTVMREGVAVDMKASFANIEIARHRPPRGSKITELIAYNRAWAADSLRLFPQYFTELAKVQKPQYFWIGCADSRVPANQIVGLAPGEVFVHSNVGNVVGRTDLCCLAALQYSVECLEVEHVIVCGHHGCGGVTAAMRNIDVGLADNWINHIVDVKKLFREKLKAVPYENQVKALCELNVITQLTHVAETFVVQRTWKKARLTHANNPGAAPGTVPSVKLHAWVYGLDHGLLHPLLTLTIDSDMEEAVDKAAEAVFARYSGVST